MRKTEVTRVTKETDISLAFSLDGDGYCDISTGIGFFDHMMTAFTVHGGFNMELSVKGDLEVDCHHTVEDSGIVLGKAFAQLLQDKTAINRFGSFYVPMDETLAFCAVDISGRSFLVFDCTFTGNSVGTFDTCMCEEFFRAFATNAGITLHIQLLYGQNDHHKIEAIFKAVAHALSIAVEQSGTFLLSTKGVL